MDKDNKKKLLQQMKANQEKEKKQYEITREQIIYNRIEANVSDLVPDIVDYLIKNNITCYSVEFKEKSTKIKSSIFDARPLTEKFEKALNDAIFGENVGIGGKAKIFDQIIKKQLSEYGITYKRDLTCASDFGFAPYVHKILCKVN